MKSLTWNQVNAWRLAQHGLSPRLGGEAFVEVASRLYGIHAQVMSAAELVLGARTDGLTPLMGNDHCPGCDAKPANFYFARQFSANCVQSRDGLLAIRA